MTPWAPRSTLRRAALRALAAFLVAAPAGCHFIHVAQAGAVTRRTAAAPRVGFEGDLDLVADALGPASGPAEVTFRYGPGLGLDGRADDDGLAGGLRGQLVAGQTSRDGMWLAQAFGRVGAEPLEERHVEAFGGGLGLTGGLPIAAFARHEPRVCRSLLFVTATLRGGLTHVPEAGTTTPSLALLLGIGHVGDAGAPSDPPRSPPCPR